MTITQTPVREQDTPAAYDTLVEVAPLPASRRTQPLAWLRHALSMISQAGQPPATPQAPLVSPNGAVIWTPDPAKRTGR